MRGAEASPNLASRPAAKVRFVMPDAQAHGAADAAMTELDTPQLAAAMEALTRCLAMNILGEESQNNRAALRAGIAELARRASLAAPYGPAATDGVGFRPAVYVRMSLFGGATGTPDQPVNVAIEKPADQLLHIAEHCIREAASRPASAIIAVVFSAVWVEAYLNQLLELIDYRVSTGLELAPPAVMPAVAQQRDLERRKRPLLEKIDSFVEMLTGRKPDRGASPYQELSLVLALRDALVHCWPTRVRSVGDGAPLTSTHSNAKETDVAALLLQLVSRGVLPTDYVATTPPILEALRKPEVARWALDAAQKVARHIANSFPTEGMKRWANRENALSGVPPRRYRLTGAGIWWSVSD